MAIIGRCLKKSKNESMFMQQYVITSVSKNGLGRPQNDLGGCRDQAYHINHQKLPLYAQSREPFHTGHGRPFRTNTKMASDSLKMTSEDAGTRPIIFSIKSYPCMPKAGSHSIQGMAGHSGQTGKQTNKQIPLCFIATLPIFSNTISSINIYSNTINIYSNTISSINIYSNTISSINI